MKLAEQQNRAIGGAVGVTSGASSEPIAVVGLANRLPGHSSSPSALWKLLLTGGIAQNAPPASRWKLDTHYDGSGRPHTVKTPGAMWLEDHDPADFDAAFFQTTAADSIAMDPQQRMLLEVVYEALENAGITLDDVSGADIGCWVGSYAVDYHDIQLRDPEDRPDGITVGIGRAILSNRISHFFNLHGPSMTVDTACSGSLVSLDVATRYLQTGQISGAIVAGANLYLSPDHTQDMGAMRNASSPSGRCHTFDAKADGYCRSEGINCVILKRLSDALANGDPIRAVIRGSATNSDGWTPGIASPAAEAQAMAMRAAYAAAGVDYHETGYLECHGTGTLAGDPVEVAAAASVLTKGRDPQKPLIIGSVKSNIGHSEPAAGVSGLIKAVLAIENNMIPGNPTFLDPNPKIDFKGLCVKASRLNQQWPDPNKRIASVNSFGYGGSNAHVVLQDVDSYLRHSWSKSHVSSRTTNPLRNFLDDDDDDESSKAAVIRPKLLVFSANDEHSLKANYKNLQRHLIDPTVSVDAYDIAYTLSDRRSRLYHRGFAVVDDLTLPDAALVTGKPRASPPRIGFVFTGQGAQWSQMGKGLIDTYDHARAILEGLDAALQALPAPPSWSLIDELYNVRSPDHLRLPEFSQPLVTALQIVLVSVLREWGISPVSVVGHSSGEIAAAYAAGRLSAEDAIKVAFFRGEAAKQLQAESKEAVGMLAVGLGPQEAEKYIGDLSATVQIACYNSPSSVTLSGRFEDLETVRKRLQEDSHFARALQVNLAYHSSYMTAIGDKYRSLLNEHTGSPLSGDAGVTMSSSVTGGRDEATTSDYWQANMVSPVRFNEAVSSLIASEGGADFLVELGPSGALAGPVSQILKTLSSGEANVRYVAASKRGPDSIMPLFEVAGQIFAAGGSVDIKKVNRDERIPASLQPKVVVDLPNYAWNHTQKYWHESDASKDWRYRKYLHHDLLGSKVLNTPWANPTFSKVLDLKDVPYLKDHRLGDDIIFPGAGFVALAIEAMYQTSQAMLSPDDHIPQPDDLGYRLRNIAFDNALVLEEDKPAKIKTTLAPAATGAHGGSWYRFTVSTTRDDITRQHCSGLVRIDASQPPTVTGAEADPLKHTTPGRLWYKAMNGAGYGFGDSFQKLVEIETTTGQRASRVLVDLREPPSAWDKQSGYPIHPAALDGIFQSVTPSLVAGVRSAIKTVLVPAVIDDLTVFPGSKPANGISFNTSEYVGKGALDEDKNYMSDATVHHPDTKQAMVRLEGLRYHRLDTGFDPLGSHTFTHLSWRPDISFFTPDVTMPVGQDLATCTDELLDLISHKKPDLRVLEVNLAADDSEIAFLGRGDGAIRAPYRSYTFASNDANLVSKTQSSWDSHRDTVFTLLDLAKSLPFAPEAAFDVIILKGPPCVSMTPSSFSVALGNLLANGGYFVKLTQRPNLKIMEEPALRSQKMKTIANFSFAQGDAAVATKTDFNQTAAVPVQIIQFGRQSPIVSAVISQLEKGGHIAACTCGKAEAHDDSVVLVLDELQEPLLNRMSSKQWGELQQVIESRAKILWVTYGSQMKVSRPQNALVHGLLRSIRSEDPGLSLTTLDVESPDSPATIAAISAVLRKMEQMPSASQVEPEYTERGGVMYVSRIVPDGPVNEYKTAETTGIPPQEGSLHDNKAIVRLRAERLGTLEGLVWGQVAPEELSLPMNKVEVEIFAAGLNFKDVAITMGIVPENTSLLGLEGAGIVRRVANDVTDFKVGDRVVVFEKGTFANRIQVTTERTHHIPDSMSFAEAATIPAVYLTSLYALYYLGDLQRGQTVLIHSAAGGVGISAIKLAQYRGAEVYVTVGTEEKRQFIQRECGIAPSRIFSSRTTTFAREILNATDGKGIDLILNSLVGELLDETWRLVADGGTMIEIGKRDILDRKQLAMEPFDRNASYRALDFSHKEISDELISDLLHALFQLCEDGSIGPISPIQEYSFPDLPSAFALVRSGKHIGKIVATQQPGEVVTVPIRPASKAMKLRPDVSYLIVGGLKGLCGSVAIWLARNGARHITVVSRSGISDDKSQAVVKNMESCGAKVYEARGDVARRADVFRAYAASHPIPVGGVIQGAMVLNDKPFESMTIDDYYGTISSKVDGTWHLHTVAQDAGVSLDFFTMLSSISGVVGQKAQANYAAANVFLDAFAVYRQSLGLPANSVDLGVIEDVGYIAERDGMQQQLDTDLWNGINETVLHKIVNYSILQQINPINPNSTAQLITGIPVPQREDSELSRDARFSGLFIPGTANGTAAGKDGDQSMQAFFLLLKSGAEAATLLSSAVEIVSRQFEKTLRLREPMEPGRALTAYGLDSLAAVEFRNWIRMQMNVELTTFDISSAASLFALCEKIVAKMQVKVAGE